MIKTQTEINAVLDLIIGATLDSGFTHVAFFSNFPKPNGSEIMDSDLINEIGRVAIASKSRIGNIATINYTIGATDCVCPSTTVATDGSNTKTSFKVTSYSNLKVNDTVQIGTETDRMILSINTGTSFITLNEALTAIPTASTAVKVKINQRALIRDGENGQYTGTIAGIEYYSKYKTNQIIQGRITGDLL